MTAINQFEYARKCVSLPVFDYMLKPMVRAEISDVLERAKKRLDESKDSWEDSKAEIETENSDENNSTELIKKYVEDNFTDSMLNLTFLAQYFGFSASYLSRKFKQDTGKNFVEYLNDLRMKKAVKIAKSNIKMYQIAAEVGIPDPNYFSKCFKKYTGMSYSDYISTK